MLAATGLALVLVVVGLISWLDTNQAESDLNTGDASTPGRGLVTPPSRWTPPSAALAPAVASRFRDAGADPARKRAPAAETSPPLPASSPRDGGRSTARSIDHSPDATASATRSAEPSTNRISKESVQAAMQAVRPQVKACYDQALGQDPSLAGQVTLQLKLIAGDGGAYVAEGEVVDSETRSPFFEACVLQKVAGAAFPSPDGEGSVTVRYPFTFDPGGGFGSRAPP